MAKRNRRRKTFKVKTGTLVGGLLVLLAIAPWVALCLVNMGIDQTSKHVQQLEREKRTLDESYRRQVAEWNQLVEPKRLDEAVAARGLRLTYAPPTRSAHVNTRGGVTLSREVAVALQTSRNTFLGEETAQVTSTTAQSLRTIRRQRRH